nr:retrovirus-related Pol polyprotein from transposon TNT 1-94 [Tanacetum cinerariifolium]
ASPTKKHLEALKRVFRYLRGTNNWGLWYPKDTAMALTAYANADHAGYQDTQRMPLLSAAIMSSTPGLSARGYIHQSITKRAIRISILASWYEEPTAKGVGLHVTDSHTGNHPKDNFMSLETIQRLYSVFGRRSHLGFEGETSKPKGRTHCISLANLRLPLNDFFCEAYDCEPSVKLFCGFFNLCKAGSWLTFQKRFEKHIPSLFAKVITHIEEMSFRNFIYIEVDEDLTFLPKDSFLDFNIGSPSVSINTKPVQTNKEPAVEHVNECVGTTADSGGVSKKILLLFMLGVLRPALGRGSAKQEEVLRGLL